MIEEYITKICKILKIQKPIILYDTSAFISDSIYAQCICEPDKQTICLKRMETPNPDYLFAIAHELRHIYQYVYDKQFFLSDYKERNKCSSVEEYNLQIAEVDANAFVAIIMLKNFGLRPQWEGYTDKVIQEINKRINTISPTLND